MMHRTAALLRRPDFWIASGFLARHAVGAWHLHRTLHSNHHQTVELLKHASRSRPPRLLVVVPVLREQDHVKEAIGWFADLTRRLSGLVEVVFVTTSRELAERETLCQLLADHGASPIRSAAWPQLRGAEAIALEDERLRSPRQRLSAEAAAKILADFPTTADVIDAHLGELGSVGLRRFHYVGGGRKAAQVNFVARQARGDHYQYLAVYDIDSRPKFDLLHRTLTFLAAEHETTGRFPEVVQQSTRFTTAGTAQAWWQRSLARGAARLQTLWTLRREIPALRRYGAAAQRPARNAVKRALTRGLAQTVGHGLLIRTDVFRDVGGLPEDTFLDDVAFGYRLTVAGIPVYSLPEMLTTPAPESIGETIAQSARWSHSYLDYPASAASARAAGHGNLLDHASALSIAAYRGATWLLASPLTVAATVLTVAPRTPAPIRGAAAAGLWLGVVEPARALAKYHGPGVPKRVIARDAAEIYAAYLIRSAGPIHTATRALLGRAAIGPFSPKTEHRNGVTP